MAKSVRHKPPSQGKRPDAARKGREPNRNISFTGGEDQTSSIYPLAPYEHGLRAQKFMFDFDTDGDLRTVSNDFGQQRNIAHKPSMK